MPEHISSKLNAFLDCELDQHAQSDVLAHLEACQSCTDELEELRRVSQILHGAPQPKFIPAEAFKDRLMLQLPRRDEALPGAAHADSRLLPWMAPALILAGWIFMQVTLNLTGLVLLAGQAGILEGVLTRAAGSPHQSLWFAAAQAAASGIMGRQVPVGLKLLNDADVFAKNLVSLLLWQVGAAALFWIALAVVWQSRAKVWQASPVKE